MTYNEAGVDNGDSRVSRGGSLLACMSDGVAVDASVHQPVFQEQLLYQAYILLKSKGSN